MDDVRAINLMGKFFEGFAKKTISLDAEGREVEDEALKKSVYLMLRKITNGFLTWYDKTREEKGWKTGRDMKMGIDTYKELPKTTGDETLKEYESDLIPIMQEFNMQGKNGDMVMEYFDSYLERIKYGWKKRIEDIKQRA